MSSARDAIERINRERDERNRKAEEARTENVKLHAGIPAFWRYLQDAMTEELDAFREGIRPHADTLQGQPVNNNNFTVFWGGRTIEVILNEPSETLDVFFTDVRNNKDLNQETYRFSASGDEVVLGGYRPAQVADLILKPLFDSYR